MLPFCKSARPLTMRSRSRVVHGPRGLLWWQSLARSGRTHALRALSWAGGAPSWARTKSVCVRRVYGPAVNRSGVTGPSSAWRVRSAVDES